MNEKNGKRRLGELLLCAALTAVLPVCGSLAGSGFDDEGERFGITNDSIAIGGCSPLDGPSAFLGKNLIAGAQAYFDDVNAHGGINGRKIKFIVHNDHYDPEQAIACFNQLLKEHVFAAGFFVGTAIAVKYMQMAERNQLPIVGMISGSDVIYQPLHPYVFGIRCTDVQQADAEISGLYSAGIRRFGIIFQNDALGASWVFAIKEALGKHGITSMAESSFDRNATNFDDAIKTVRSTNPEAVILAGVYDPVGRILMRSHESGWHPIFCTFGTEAYVKVAGKDAENTVITTAFPSVSRSDLPVVAALARTLKAYSPHTSANLASLEGFINASIVCEALKRAGKDLTRSGYISALEHMQDYDVGLGPQFRLRYAPGNHHGYDVSSDNIVKNGKLTTITNWQEVLRDNSH